MKEKMTRWGIDEDAQQRVVEYLVANRYVDDRRYARSFVNDKLKYNKWGPRKIEQSLWMKHIDESILREYVCFEVRGDSMDDGMRHSYAQGDIVLCRNVDRLYWMKKLHYNSWNAFVIVHKEGIVLKQIVAHDVERGIITVHSYNPYYEDFDIDLRDVYQILNVVKTQRNG